MTDSLGRVTGSGGIPYPRLSAGELSIHEIAAKGDLLALERLIEGDATLVNTLDIAGKSPLYYAVKAALYNTVVYLIEHGADTQLSFSVGNDSYTVDSQTIPSTVTAVLRTDTVASGRSLRTAKVEEAEDPIDLPSPVGHQAVGVTSMADLPCLKMREITKGQEFSTNRRVTLYELALEGDRHDVYSSFRIRELLLSKGLPQEALQIKKEKFNALRGNSYASYQVERAFYADSKEAFIKKYLIPGSTEINSAHSAFSEWLSNKTNPGDFLAKYPTLFKATVNFIKTYTPDDYSRSDTLQKNCSYLLQSPALDFESASIAINYMIRFTRVIPALSAMKLRSKLPWEVLFTINLQKGALRDLAELRSKGCPINGVVRINKKLICPLQYAVKKYDRVDLLKTLVQQGALSFHPDSEDPIPAHIQACLKGKTAFVKVLIEAGADIDTVYEGKTLLYHAFEQKNQSLVEYLLSKGATCLLDGEKDPGLFKKIGFQGALCQILLQMRYHIPSSCYEGLTLLHQMHAAGADHLALFLAQMDDDLIDFDEVNSHGQSVYISLLLNEDLNDHQYKLMHVLFAKGANINIYNHQACRENNIPVIKRLALLGADFTKRNLAGERAIDLLSPTSFSTFTRVIKFENSEETLAAAMTDRNIAHVLGDSFITDMKDDSGEGLEGNNPVTSINLLLQLLELIPERDLPEDQTKVQEVIEHFKRLVINSSILDGITGNREECLEKLQSFVQAISTKIHLLTVGEKLLLPLGWIGSELAESGLETLPGSEGGHTMLLEIERTDQDKFDIHVINSGGGLSFHSSVQMGKKEKHSSVLVFKDITLKEISSQDWLRTVFEPNTMFHVSGVTISPKYSETDIYKAIFLPFEKKRVRDLPEDIALLSSQLSGTCSFSVLLAYLKLSLSPDSYKKLKHDISMLTYESACERLSPDKKTLNRILQLSGANLARMLRKMRDTKRLSDPSLVSEMEFLERSLDKMHSADLAEPELRTRVFIPAMGDTVSPADSKIASAIASTKESMHSALSRSVKVEETSCVPPAIYDFSACEGADSLVECLQAAALHTSKNYLAHPCLTQSVLSLPMPGNRDAEDLWSHLSPEQLALALTAVNTISDKLWGDFLGHKMVASSEKVCSRFLTYVVAHRLIYLIEHKTRSDSPLISDYGIDASFLKPYYEHLLVHAHQPDLEEKFQEIFSYAKASTDKSKGLFAYNRKYSVQENCPEAVLLGGIMDALPVDVKKAAKNEIAEYIKWEENSRRHLNSSAIGDPHAMLKSALFTEHGKLKGALPPYYVQLRQHAIFARALVKYNGKDFIGHHGRNYNDKAYVPALIRWNSSAKTSTHDYSAKDLLDPHSEALTHTSAEHQIAHRYVDNCYLYQDKSDIDQNQVAIAQSKARDRWGYTISAEDNLAIPRLIQHFSPCMNELTSLTKQQFFNSVFFKNGRLSKELQSTLGAKHRLLSFAQKGIDRNEEILTHLNTETQIKEVHKILLTLFFFLQLKQRILVYANDTDGLKQHRKCLLTLMKRIPDEMQAHVAMTYLASFSCGEVSDKQEDLGNLLKCYLIVQHPTQKDKIPLYSKDGPLRHSTLSREREAQQTLVTIDPSIVIQGECAFAKHVEALHRCLDCPETSRALLIGTLSSYTSIASLEAGTWSGVYPMFTVILEDEQQYSIDVTTGVVCNDGKRELSYQDLVKLPLYQELCKDILFVSKRCFSADMGSAQFSARATSENGDSYDFIFDDTRVLSVIKNGNQNLLWKDEWPSARTWPCLPKYPNKEHYNLWVSTEGIVIEDKDTHSNVMLARNDGTFDFDGERHQYVDITMNSHLQTLTQFEEGSKITLWKSTSSNNFSLQFPRYTDEQGVALSFIKEADSSKFFLKSNPQYFISEVQSWNGIPACKRYLILENLEGERKLIIPRMTVSFRTDSTQIEEQVTCLFFDLDSDDSVRANSIEKSCFLAYQALAHSHYELGLRYLKQTHSLQEYSNESFRQLAAIYHLADEIHDNTPNACSLRLYAAWLAQDNIARFRRSHEKEPSKKTVDSINDLSISWRGFWLGKVAWTDKYLCSDAKISGTIWASLIGSFTFSYLNYSHNIDVAYRIDYPSSLLKPYEEQAWIHEMLKHINLEKLRNYFHTLVTDVSHTSVSASKSLYLDNEIRDSSPPTDDDALKSVGQLYSSSMDDYTSTQYLLSAFPHLFNESILHPSKAIHERFLHERVHSRQKLGNMYHLMIEILHSDFEQKEAFIYAIKEWDESREEGPYLEVLRRVDEYLHSMGEPSFHHQRRAEETITVSTKLHLYDEPSLSKCFPLTRPGLYIKRHFRVLYRNAKYYPMSSVCQALKSQHSSTSSGELDPNALILELLHSDWDRKYKLLVIDLVDLMSKGGSSEKQSKYLLKLLESYLAYCQQDTRGFRSAKIEEGETPPTTLRSPSASITLDGLCVLVKTQSASLKLPEPPKKEDHLVLKPLTVHREYETYFAEFFSSEASPSDHDPFPALSMENPYLMTRMKRQKKDYDIACSRNDAIETYELKDGKDLNSLKASVLSHITESQNEMKELRVAIIEFANSFPEDHDLAIERKLQRIGQLRHKLTFDDCIKLFIKESFSYYQQHVDLSDENIYKLHYLIARYMLQATFLQQSFRMREAILKVEGAEEGDRKVEFTQELASICSEKQHYQPHLHPSFLAFEYASHKLIREDQVVSLLQMCDEGDFSNVLLQKIMGGGKTYVLGTLMAQIKADGYHLSLLVTPAALYDTNSQDMKQRTNRFFHQDAQTIRFDRSPACFSQEYLSWVKHTLLHAITEREYLILAPASLQCMENKYIEESDKLASLYDALDTAATPAHRELILNKIKEDGSRLRDLKFILKVLSERAVCTFDEVDTLMTPTQEVNFPVGRVEHFSRPLAKLLAEVFYIAATDESLCSLIRLQENKQSLMALEDQEKVLNILLTKLLSRFSKDEYWVQKFGISDDTQWEYIQAYIRGEIALPSFVLSLDENAAEMIILLKKELSTWLQEAWNKNADVHYGFSKLHLEKGVAIPYLASDVPNEKADFADPYETANKTLQLYLVKGLRESQYHDFVTRLRREATKQWNLSGRDIPLSETKAARDFLEATGIGMFHFDLKNTEDCDELHQAFLSKNPMITRLLLDYVADLVLPKMELHIEQVHNNPQNLASIVSIIQGYTGTMENIGSLPFVCDIVEEEGTNGQTIDLLFRKNTPVHAVDLSVELPHITGTTRALIDIAALYKGISNQEVAKKLLRSCSEDIKGVLYYDNSTNLLAYIARGSEESPILLPATDAKTIKAVTGCTPNDLFTFYDQRHTTGVDIKQMNDATALVTVGEHLYLRDLLQGVMRMRGFTADQTCRMLVPKEVIPLIANAIGKVYGAGELPTIHDIIAFATLNEAKRQEKHNLQACVQKLRNVARSYALKLAYATEDPGEEATIMLHARSLLIRKMEYGLLSRFAEDPIEQDILDYLNQLKKQLMSTLESLHLEPVPSQILNEMEAIIKRALPTLPGTVLSHSYGDNTHGSTVEAFAELDLQNEDENDEEMDLELELEAESDNRDYRYPRTHVHKTWSESDPLTYKDYPETSVSNPAIWSLESTFAGIPALSPYKDCLGSHLFLSENYVQTIQGSDSLFSSAHKAPYQALLIRSQSTEYPWKIVILSLADAAHFRGHMPKNAWLIEPDGTSLASYDDSEIPLDDSLKETLVPYLAFAGEMRTLNSEAWMPAFKTWAIKNPVAVYSFIEKIAVNTYAMAPEDYYGSRMELFLNELVPATERMAYIFEFCDFARLGAHTDSLYRSMSKIELDDSISPKHLHSYLESACYLVSNGKKKREKIVGKECLVAIFKQIELSPPELQVSLVTSLIENHKLMIMNQEYLNSMHDLILYLKNHGQEESALALIKEYYITLQSRMRGESYKASYSPKSADKIMNELVIMANIWGETPEGQLVFKSFLKDFLKTYFGWQSLFILHLAVSEVAFLQTLYEEYADLCKTEYMEKYYDPKFSPLRDSRSRPLSSEERQFFFPNMRHLVDLSACKNVPYFEAVYNECIAFTQSKLDVWLNSLESKRSSRDRYPYIDRSLFSKYEMTITDSNLRLPKKDIAPLIVTLRAIKRYIR